LGNARRGLKAESNKRSKTMPLPAIIPLRPLVLMSGFLGAGKTTFLRLILQDLAPHAIQTHVVLNEWENARMDCETLREHATDVTPLVGACVCCDSLDELYELLLKAAKSESDVLFVELNGTADPIPILETFTLTQSQFKLQPRWQVCVIDARMFGNRGYYNHLESLQLESASHYHITRASALDDGQMKKLIGEIRAVNPHATPVTPGELGCAVRQVLESASRKAISVESSAAGRGAVSLHAHHQLAHEFTGCQIILPDTPLPTEKVMTWLCLLPMQAIRAKILLRVAEDPSQRMLFDRVGAEICERPIPVPIRDSVPSSAVMIGPELDPIQLLDLAQTYLDADCRLG